MIYANEQINNLHYPLWTINADRLLIYLLLTNKVISVMKFNIMRVWFLIHLPFIHIHAISVSDNGSKSLSTLWCNCMV